MSQEWTRKDVLANPIQAVQVINECLTNTVEMRSKIGQQQNKIMQLRAELKIHRDLKNQIQKLALELEAKSAKR